MPKPTATTRSWRGAIMDVVYRHGRGGAGSTSIAPTTGSCRGGVPFEEKGQLRHEKEGLKHVYYPVTAQRRPAVAVRHVVGTFFNGCAAAIAALLDEPTVRFPTRNAPRCCERDRACAPEQQSVGGGNYLAAADSAQAVSTVYAASLLATLPIILAAVAALVLRRASAEGRVLVWRSAVVALLLIFFGRQLPLHWMAWAVPATLATPLVALGRVQVTSADGARGATVFVAALLLVYVAGFAAVLVRTLAASIAVRRIARRGHVLDDGWTVALEQTRATLGVTREVRLVGTVEIAMPMTWGWLRPVVVIPDNAAGLDASQRRIVLLHELVHVRASDWLFNLVARAACARPVSSGGVVARAAAARRLRARVRRARGCVGRAAQRLRRAVDRCGRAVGVARAGVGVVTAARAACAARRGARRRP